MKVCYWGTFERDYPRNAVLLSGLRQNDIEVIECHFPLWREGVRYGKVGELSALGGKLRVFGRALLVYPILLFRYLLLRRHDVVVIGYLGHLDVLFLYPLARLRRKPIVFDAFFSLYDTAIYDWELAGKQSCLARILLTLDKFACRLSSLVLVDTKAQKEFFCSEFGLPDAKVRWVYVGADDSVFAPAINSINHQEFRVVYVGNYVPLHGVSVILEAAALLSGENVEFWMIGDPPPSQRTEIEKLNRGRIRLFGWTPPQELRTIIAQADACLGLFGTSAKAQRVIPGKAFLALAMGKPLVTGDSPAARELLENGKTALLCEPGDADALARAILRLRDDPSLLARIGSGGRRLFETHCSPKVLGRRLVTLIEETVKARVQS